MKIKSLSRGEIVSMSKSWFEVKLDSGEIVETQMMATTGFKKGQYVKGVICTGAVTKKRILCDVQRSRKVLRLN